MTLPGTSLTDLAMSVWSLLILIAIPLWVIDRRTRRTEKVLNDVLTQLRAHGLSIPEPSDAVKALALDPAKKVEAIRAYRQQSGAGLYEALDAVERVGRRPAG